MTALASALALAPAAVTLADDGGDLPGAKSQPATTIGPDHATLQGKVNPREKATNYWFEFGTTTNYGQSTPVQSAGHGEDWASVAKPVVGLVPATTYHFRVVASNPRGNKPGDDATFTTAAADGTPAPTPGGGDGHSGSGDGSRGSDSSHDGAASPELGRSVGLDPADGVVRVRKPDDKGFGALDPGGTVPTGTVVDARDGKVSLTTAVTPGTTQTATFWGGVFEVRQARNGHGYTDLHLRGASLATCPRTAKPAATSAKRRRGASLWGSDRGGRFRTHGRNSVATVRGTQWLTTDRCNGTLTFVRAGAVAVRDLNRHRTVFVRTGHAYLARTPR